MADAYWRYGDNSSRQQQQQQPIPSHLAKRPRSDFEMPSGGPDISIYYARDDNNPSSAAHLAAAASIRDTDTINASYDRYLRNSSSQLQQQQQQIPSYGALDSGRSMATGLLPHDDHRLINNSLMPSKPSAVTGQRENRLPPDATPTLYVEGLPANCTRREVAHIFRPFVGYKEVRLVTKESRRPGGDPLVLCFVDFQSPAHAATAMDAIQGYAFDEHERESSAHLRLQFARNPGARSGPGSRGKR